MKKILIICTANKTRSPLAMEIANNIAQRKRAPYVFKSAGIAAISTHIDDNVVEVLDEIGIKTAHTPVGVGDFNIADFDALHVMTQRQKITLCSYYKIDGLDKKITVLGVENPFMLGIEAYRECREKFIEFYEMYIK